MNLNQDISDREVMGRLRIPVTLRKRPLKGQFPEAVGVISAIELTKRYEVPIRNFRKRTGYQREVSTPRVNQLVADLRKKRVDLPTAVLLNLRSFDKDRNIEFDGERAWLQLDEDSLYVVDGQHRIEALARLVDENLAEWGNYQLAFTCLLGATELEEMEEFYVVNSTAKSVRTDLALDLLKQRVESDPKLMEALQESGQSWKVEGQAVAEALSRTTLWTGRIRFPGEPKGTTTIGSSGMVGSLRDLLSNHYFGSIQRDQRVEIINCFWRGVALVIPDVFSDPPAYSIQKSTGVQVMHGVLVSVLEYLRSIGASLKDPQSYADALQEALPGLEGETSSGLVASGADFWKAGPEGAAGSFSSNAGRRVLTARIRALLPSPEVE